VLLQLTLLWHQVLFVLSSASFIELLLELLGDLLMIVGSSTVSISAPILMVAFSAAGNEMAFTCPGQTCGKFSERREAMKTLRLLQ